MFREHDQQAERAVNQVLDQLGYGSRPLNMRPIPFAGQWGTSTSVAFQLANASLSKDPPPVDESLPKREARAKLQAAVRERSLTIADQIAAGLADNPVFARVESVNGYVNIYYDTQKVAQEVVRAAIDRGPDFGRGPKKTGKVMVEFSQPNTHKAFHVGHARNASLGNALSNIAEFSGYETIRANYIGDIGLHVIKTLWCMQTFHNVNDVPEHDRGRWLGNIYTESDQRLEYRKSVIELLNELSTEDAIFVGKIDRLMKQLHDAGGSGSDVAYLLGRFAGQAEIDPAQIEDFQTITLVWPFIGEQLHEELAYVKEHGPQKAPPPVSRTATIKNPLPVVTEENTTDRIERWEHLGQTLDWWEHAPEWEQQVRALFQLWERKDPDFMALWKQTREWSMDEFLRIYKEMGIHFDVWFFESEVEEEGREIVKELVERGIAELSEGLTVVKIDEKLGLTKETYRTLPILRSDGTTLYSTKDLALTKRKFDEYKVDRSVWVVDVGQSLYFQQIFKIMELWGFKQAAKCYHLAYEIVTLPSGTMSSRSGNVVLYDDVAGAMTKRAREIIDERTIHTDLTGKQKDEIAHEVAIGSLMYTMLARDNNTVIVFDLEDALSFAGHAAPYIQYAHARACRILERAGDIPQGYIDFQDLQQEEVDLIDQIGNFPLEIEKASESYRPLEVADYVYELARKFNDFYADYDKRPVLAAPEPQRTMRVALVAATRQALSNGLHLLGVAAPEVM